jgi:hypothetical protein
MREDYRAFPAQAEGLVQLQIRGYGNYSVFVHNPKSSGHPVIIDAHLVKSVLEVIAQQSGYQHVKVEEAKRLEEMCIVEIVKGGRGSPVKISAPHGKDIIEALVNAGYTKPEKR